MSALVIIGGGAAGIFCAVNAARLHPTLQIIVVEKSNKLLSKVRISGGGRCNLTHACTSIAHMSKCYPRGEKFVKQTFSQFFTTDTIAWFESRGVPLQTEADGRMFPASNTSESIIDCLLQEARKYKIEILLQNGVENIAKDKEEFTLQLSSGKSIIAKYVCIACGGFPKIEQFHFIAKLGHSIQEPTPSLFTFNTPNHSLTQLMGVAVNHAEIKIASTKLAAKGAVLITHWGLSGPTVLKLSAFAAKHLQSCNYRYTIVINWQHTYNETQLLEAIRNWRNELATQNIGNKNPLHLPNRLWDFLLSASKIDPTTKWANLQAKQQNSLAKNCTTCTIQANGKTTFKDEFVTAGGVTLSEINNTTMESKLVKNLFFAGEIIDVDGITGGYNFQNAWTTGFIVANNKFS